MAHLVMANLHGPRQLIIHVVATAPLVRADHSEPEIDTVHTPMQPYRLHTVQIDQVLIPDQGVPCCQFSVASLRGPD